MSERATTAPEISALTGVRVLDLSTGIAGPLAAMLLADFGAEVVKVEPPSGDPGRSRPGFAMWNRNKRGVVVDLEHQSGREHLATLLAGADVCIAGRDDDRLNRQVDPETACAANPGLVYLSLPSFLAGHRWAGGHESAGLLGAMSGMCLRQNSFEGGPVDPSFPFVLYLQAAWAAAAAMAALVERTTSGHGQIVTVGGMHAAMVAASSSLVIDPDAPELLANAGPGGPNPLYTRYRCGDGRWVFLATLTPKFQRRALGILGLEGLLEDERIDGRLEATLEPANRAWVRECFAAVLATRSSDEWLEVLGAADVPVGPLLRRGEWMDSPRVVSVGARVELDDPERGLIVMPGNPINLVATPASIRRPAPGLEQLDDLPHWDPRPETPGAPPVGHPPLRGVRVLDLGTILAGPYAGTLLAELGADVIKVEIPAGDSWRERGMPYIRGQRGVALDLRTDGGLAAFLKLVSTADVVVDNYRAGVLKRLQIDYADLVEINPAIISVSITGFGEGGPFSSEPAFDPLLQASSGMMLAQGGNDEPVLMTVAVNDVTTAALAALGTLLALFHRQRTGSGQKVWLSLAATSTFAQSEELLRLRGEPERIVGGRDFKGPGATDRFYRTSDGWIRLQADGMVDLLAEAGFVSEAGPGAGGSEEVFEQLAAVLNSMTSAEACERLSGAGLPASPARSLKELASDEECKEWGVLSRMDRGDGGSVLVPGRYARFSRSQGHDLLRPPGVGEHTVEVLTEAGLDETTVADLLASGAARAGAPMVYRPQAAYR